MLVWIECEGENEILNMDHVRCIDYFKGTLQIYMINALNTYYLETDEACQLAMDKIFLAFKNNEKALYIKIEGDEMNAEQGYAILDSADGTNRKDDHGHH